MKIWTDIITHWFPIAERIPRMSSSNWELLIYGHFFDCVLYWLGYQSEWFSSKWSWFSIETNLKVIFEKKHNFRINLVYIFTYCTRNVTTIVTSRPGDISLVTRSLDLLFEETESTRQTLVKIRSIKSFEMMIIILDNKVTDDNVCKHIFSFI